MGHLQIINRMALKIESSFDEIAGNVLVNKVSLNMVQLSLIY